MQFVEVRDGWDIHLGGTESTRGSQLQRKAHYLDLGHKPSLQQRFLQISQQRTSSKLSRQSGATFQR